MMEQNVLTKQSGKAGIIISGFAICLLFTTVSVFGHPFSKGNSAVCLDTVAPVYAVLIKQSSYDKAEWQEVADSLVAKYNGELFIWNSSVNDVKVEVAAYRPTHIGFVCELSTASPSFVQNSFWPFNRDLDADAYIDAVAGIITGYNAQDALNLVTGDGFEIKTVLGGTTSCDLIYYTQGIATSESTSGLYYIKYADSLSTITCTDGPTDRTEWLVSMLNDSIDIFNYDPVDIFYTSGHGNYNLWQLHYPSASPEGYFRSSNGQVYGDPYSGSNININSDNPKIYFGLGNCNIGQIYNGGSMAPSWIHTGGACQYTGYVIGEGSTSCQHGGTKAYFYKASRSNTWAEAYFLSNIALKFDMLNGTPGANPPDWNGSALYGDPAMQVKMSNEGVFQQPLFSSELNVIEGAERDTVTFMITMNRDGSPGFTSKWGERHPAIILPFRADSVEIIYTDAISAVIEDNFALMYIWYQGQPSLAEGETREVTFTYNKTTTGIDEPKPLQKTPDKFILAQNYPNPFNPITTINYSVPRQSTVKIIIFDALGREVTTLVNEEKPIGDYVVEFYAKGLSSGIYFYQIRTAEFMQTNKMILLR
jgi:hypothetical protein